MKKLVLFLVLAGVCFLSYTNAMGIDASVNVPGPIDINPVMIRVEGTGENTSDWGTTPVTVMSFDPLELKEFTDPTDPNKKYSVFQTDHFYSIDIGYLYGTGTGITSISFVYADDLNPDIVGNGLGAKTSVTLMKKYRIDGVEKEDDPLTDAIGKFTLYEMNGRTVTLSDLGTAWLRLYVGLVTKDPDAPLKEDDPKFQVFAPGSPPGVYSGTLTISSL